MDEDEAPVSSNAPHRSADAVAPPVPKKPALDDMGVNADALQALTQQLQQQLAAEQATQAKVGVQKATTTEPTFFGFTMGALFAGLIISTIGIGYLRYAKSTAEPIIAIFGLALLVIPFFITQTLWLSLVGGTVALLPFVLRRVGLI